MTNNEIERLQREILRCDDACFERDKEIAGLRQEIERYRKALEIIAGSADKLQATQARGALDNIGAAVSRL